MPASESNRAPVGRPTQQPGMHVSSAQHATQSSTEASRPQASTTAGVKRPRPVDPEDVGWCAPQCPTNHPERAVESDLYLYSDCNDHDSKRLISSKTADAATDARQYVKPASKPAPTPDHDSPMEIGRSVTADQMKEIDARLWLFGEVIVTLAFDVTAEEEKNIDSLHAKSNTALPVTQAKIMNTLIYDPARDGALESLGFTKEYPLESHRIGHFVDKVSADFGCGDKAEPTGGTPGNDKRAKTTIKITRVLVTEPREMVIHGLKVDGDMRDHAKRGTGGHYESVSILDATDPTTPEESAQQALRTIRAPNAMSSSIDPRHPAMITDQDYTRLVGELIRDFFFRYIVAQTSHNREQVCQIIQSLMQTLQQQPILYSEPEFDELLDKFRHVYRMPNASETDLLAQGVGVCRSAEDWGKYHPEILRVLEMGRDELIRTCRELVAKSPLRFDVPVAASGQSRKAWAYSSSITGRSAIQHPLTTASMSSAPPVRIGVDGSRMGLDLGKREQFRYHAGAYEEPLKLDNSFYRYTDAPYKFSVHDAEYTYWATVHKVAFQWLPLSKESRFEPVFCAPPWRLQSGKLDRPDADQPTASDPPRPENHKLSGYMSKLDGKYAPSGTGRMGSSTKSKPETRSPLGYMRKLDGGLAAPPPKKRLHLPGKGTEVSKESEAALTQLTDNLDVSQSRSTRGRQKE